MKNIAGISFTEFPTALDRDRQMLLARAAGFKATVLSLADDAFEERFAAASAANISVAAIRLPMDGVNLLWQSEEKWERLHALYLACFDAVKNKGVQNVIAAVSAKDAPIATQGGLFHLRKLAEEAEQRGVRLLFENTQSREHFELAVRNCCLGYHGVCFRPSVAAQHWGSSKIPSFAKKHLHFVELDDILDGNDEYIPYDGTVRYNAFLEDLAEISYRGVYYARVSPMCVKYRNLRYEEFASRTYEGLCRMERECNDAEGIV